MTSRSLGHRAPLLWLVIPVMAGLAAGQIAEIAPPFWLLLAALTAAGLALLAADRPGWWALGLGIAMSFAGMAAYGLQRARLQGGEPPLLLLPSEAWTPEKGRKGWRRLGQQ